MNRDARQEGRAGTLLLPRTDRASRAQFGYSRVILEAAASIIAFKQLDPPQPINSHKDEQDHEGQLDESGRFVLSAFAVLA